MATKKKGLTVLSGEWAKHLRKFRRRLFWRKQRQDDKKRIRCEKD